LATRKRAAKEKEEERRSVMQIAERAAKHQRVIAVMDQLDLDVVVLRKSPNTAWFSGGRVHVPSSLDSSCFDIIIDRDGYYFHTNAIEAPRLKAEELLPTDELRAHPWWIARDTLLPTGPRVGSDSPGGDRIHLPQLDQLRLSLHQAEVERLDQIATDAAAALFSLSSKVNPNQTEVEVAGQISAALWERNLETVFLGVAGASRVTKYRHPLPTTELVGNQLSISICARRKGLIASETRIFCFEPISQQRQDEYQNLLMVEAAFLAHTNAGELLSNAFKAGAGEYVKQGFASNEWHHHHQGGPTGFLPRESIANADLHVAMLNNQAISWNPTALGLKAESTWLITDAGAQKVGTDPSWPQLQVAGQLRPTLLEIS
jgi:Xaa-Pro aminopeptidase